MAGTVDPMGDSRVTSVKCGNCDEPHARDAVDLILAGERLPCTRCGSHAVKVDMHVAETITLHERLDLKAKRLGSKRPFMEQRVGDDQNRKSGRWSKIHRLIDRENDRYVEHIADEEGIVVRDVDVPLSEHRGHGSDRSRPKTHP